MSIRQKLTGYIEQLLELPHEEWSVEHIQLGTEEFMDASLITPELEDEILDTYTFYSTSSIVQDVYPFTAYFKDQLIAIGYQHFEDRHCLYLNNIQSTLHDELHLLGLSEEAIHHVHMD